MNLHRYIYNQDCFRTGIERNGHNCITFVEIDQIFIRIIDQFTIIARK